jgi:drug/metabolite transporter (DMT)-like permease
VDTLLGFFTFTKGVEYLLAIAFLIAFIAFWLWVYGREKGKVIKIGVLLYLVLGFLILVGSCLTSAPR